MISGISSMSTASLTEMRQQMFNRIDTNADGSIDKSEMTALIEQNASSLVSSIFGSQDTNQDDLIGMIEFESEMAKLGQQMKQEDGLSGASGMSAPPPAPDKVFDTADANEDGIVTKEELEAVMGKSGGNIDKLFGRVDTDGDGSITRAEDEAFRDKMPKMKQASGISGESDISAPPPPPDKVFDTADVNEDGIVTKDELAAVLGQNGDVAGKLFSQVDTDGDGSITHAEDEAFRDKIPERTETSKLSDLVTESGFKVDWQTRMLGALLEGLMAADDSSSKSASTSLYA